MGGSGSGWSNWSSGGTSIDKSVADAAMVSAYEAEANAFLQDLLASYNNRDAAAIQKHLAALQQAIEKDIGGQITILFGGSVNKHTYVDGLSDVDVLMFVSDSSLANATPQQLLTYFEKRISERLPNTNVKAGALAVTVTYADGTQIQVLPGLRTATGIRIASPDGTGWSNVVRPQDFARKLTSVNQSCGGKVVPVAKLFKGLQASLPEGSQLEGYHVESLAIEAFKNYNGRQTYKDMLLHFVKHSVQRVLSPINDTTGQSLHVDDYLGAPSSTERVRVAHALNRLANRLSAADSRASIEHIKGIFGE